MPGTIITDTDGDQLHIWERAGGIGLQVNSAAVLLLDRTLLSALAGALDGIVPDFHASYTPPPLSLPTEPGLYVLAHHAGLLGEGVPIYRLSPTFGWVDDTGARLGEDQPRQMPTAPLVRLAPDPSSISH